MSVACDVWAQWMALFRLWLWFAFCSQGIQKSALRFSFTVWLITHAGSLKFLLTKGIVFCFYYSWSVHLFLPEVFHVTDVYLKISRHVDWQNLNLVLNLCLALLEIFSSISWLPALTSTFVQRSREKWEPHLASLYVYASYIVWNSPLLLIKLLLM